MELENALLRQELKFDGIRRLYPVAIYAACLVLLLSVGLWALVRWGEIKVEYARIEAQKQRPTTTTAPTGGVPSVVGKNPADTPGLTILLDTVGRAGEQKGAVPAGKTTLLGPLLSMVDSLVGLGKLTAETASDLKKELVKNAIEGGKEILVDAAKTVIHKYLGSGGEGASPTPGIQVNVASGCCCQPPVPPPHRDGTKPKKIQCPGNADVAPAKPPAQ